jgi:hypothetical protein
VIFSVKPLAFDTSDEPVFDDQGRELFGVFSYDDGPDEAPYCNFSGSRFECTTQAREWNDKLARGETVHVSGPILRYF